jgi:CDP-glucose 4,6-dehydratase
MNREFWAGKNVLLTGAGGFKGSHLVEKLAETEANIVSLVRDFDPRSYFQTRRLHERSTVVTGDVKDFHKVADVLSKYEITTILHLAAQPIETIALLNPLETLQTNILGTVHMLEAARLYSRATEIVIVSSDKAYGPGERMPYRESGRLQGKTPYDVSKSCADLIAQVYTNPDVYNMPIAIARCANVFGPGDLNMNRIVPGTLEAIIKHQPLKIRSNAKLIREYIYVKDTADGYLSLAENMDVAKGQAFNLAGGNVMSVTQIVRRIGDILGEPVQVEILDTARGEIAEQRLDGSKMRDLVGWQAKTDFADAIRETFEWYKGLLAG